MKISSAFPSNYLKADADVPDRDDGGCTLTISSVKLETVGQGAQAEDKPVCYFEEVDKGLVLNKTNANAIAAMYGDETKDWVGKRVRLGAQDVEYQGKITRGIRVSSRPPNGPTPPAKPPGPPQNHDDEDSPF